MRAAYCTAAGEFEIREVPVPTPGPQEVLLRVRSCGVCGSDLHWFHGLFPPPVVCPGHEIAAEVVACGPEVQAIRAGDRVALEPLRVCGICPPCRVGQYQVCQQLQILGLSCDGGFAEYVTIPAARVYRLPETLDFTTGALAEPAAVCVHGVRLARVSVGDRVLVLGAGTIGLLSVLAARAAGATEVVVTARYQHQARMARQLGATLVFSPGPEENSEFAAFFRNCPADVVIETVGGQSASIETALTAVRPRGTLVVLGVFTRAVTFNALLLVTKEVRVVGSLTYGRHRDRADFDDALQILAAHREQARQLVTHRFALDAIQTAFDIAADKQTGAIKVAVVP